MVCPFRNISKQGQRVVVAAPTDDGRRPQSGPDFKDCEDPGWLLLTLGNRSYFVGVTLSGSEPGCFLSFKRRPQCLLFPAAIDRIPRDSLDPAIADFVQA